MVLFRKMSLKKCKRARMLCFWKNFKASVFLLCLVSWKDYISIYSKVLQIAFNVCSSLKQMGFVQMHY